MSYRFNHLAAMTDPELDSAVASTVFPPLSVEAAEPPLFTTTWGGFSALAMRMRTIGGIRPWREHLDQLGLARTFRGFAIAAVLAAQTGGQTSAA